MRTLGKPLQQMQAPDAFFSVVYKQQLESLQRKKCWFSRSNNRKAKTARIKKEK